MDIGTTDKLDLSKTADARRKDLRTFRLIMIFLAVVTVVIGGALLPWHETVQLDESRARQVGSAFLAAGIADSLVLYFWDRIFGGV